MQQKINRFQKTISHKKSLAMINLAFKAESKILEILLFKPKPKLQAFERAITKKVDFRSTARFVASIYLECFKYLFDPKKFKLKNDSEKLFF